MTLLQELDLRRRIRAARTPEELLAITREILDGLAEDLGILSQEYRATHPAHSTVQ